MNYVKYMMVIETELKQMYEEELNRFCDIINRVTCTNVPIFSSTLSSTRFGGTNSNLRACDDGALPVRVPLKRIESMNLNEHNAMMTKKFERQLRAKAYRTMRFKRKPV